MAHAQRIKLHANILEISMEAGELADVRNPYIGQAFANSLIADALELTERFGVFSNELQTSEEPYGWKIVLQEEVLSKEREEKEQEMRLCGYLMLASVENASFIAFEYRYRRSSRAADVASR